MPGNGSLWMKMGNFLLLSIHISTEMKAKFTIKQNECVACFSIMHPVKVTVHKIQSHLMICVIQFMDCLICMHMQQMYCIFCWRCAQNFGVQIELTKRLQTTSILRQIPPVFSLTCVFFTSLTVYSDTCHLKPFHITVNCFYIWKRHIKNYYMNLH
jgi:hypothetical protein